MDKLFTVQLEHYNITATFSRLIEMPELAHVKAQYEHYKPGNVVYCSYWNSYDYVIDFRLTEYGTWEVEVISCDVTGRPPDGAKTRVHCTSKDRNDKVIDSDMGKLAKKKQLIDRALAIEKEYDTIGRSLASYTDMEHVNDRYQEALENGWAKDELGDEYERINKELGFPKRRISPRSLRRVV